MVQSTAGFNNGRLSRKRARQACIECRERKIRCDVTKHGRPCTNCRETDVSCSVKARKNARVSQRATEDPSPPTNSTNGEQVNDRFDTGDDYMPQSYGNGLGHEPTVPSNDAQTQSQYNAPVVDFNVSNMNQNGSPDFSNESLYAGLDSFIDADLMNLVGIENVFNTSESYPEFGNVNGSSSFENPAFPNNNSHSAGKFPISFASTPEAHNTVDSPFSPNVYADDSMADRQVLHSQGCLNIPHPTILEPLARLYFEFVHPNLPIIDEGEFWKLFPKHSEDVFQIQDFSLTVLQAMMFAAVSLASEDLSRQCGFSTVKRARMAFYRRAKMLIDMEFEPDPFRLSQASLLLTFHSPVANGLRINSRWLLTAIHFARVVGADNFARLSASSELRRKRALKRLWWGCVLRDRIMPLGVRRPIQIRIPIEPEEDDQHYLHEDDFAEEMGRSRFHTLSEQKRIYRLVNTTCRLAEALTPAMELLFSSTAPGITVHQSPGSLEEILRVKADLQSWQNYASRQFPSPIGLGDESNAVILFANMMFIYYDIALISLYHQYMVTKESQTIYGSRKSLHEDAAKQIVATIDDVTDRTKELVQLNIARYAPISLSAYLAFPLLLHALNVRSSRCDDYVAAQERRRLDIYTRVMQIQRTIYEGCDYPCDVIDKILAYSNEHNITPPADEQSSAHGSEDASKAAKPTALMKWTDLLERRPRLYLRLASHIDLAFCTSLPPKEDDFAIPLRRHHIISARRRHQQANG